VFVLSKGNVVKETDLPTEISTGELLEVKDTAK
jgi:hypothetical protein